MKVDIEYIWRLKNALATINKMPLEEIDFYENNEKIEIDEHLVSEFSFTGLNNVDFITSGYYRKDSILG